jgi:hypothetical protein
MNSSEKIEIGESFKAISNSIEKLRIDMLRHCFSDRAYKDESDSLLMIIRWFDKWGDAIIKEETNGVIEK